MIKSKSKRLEKELVSQTVSGWTIQSYLNAGKSAAVFKAEKEKKLAAIKFFDPEIVDKFGAEIQRERIEREKKLIGKTHPHLVEIFDGGYWEEQGLWFIVMEFLPWKNLAEVLTALPVGLERSIISQVASAANFLEGLSICHRDIKPDNIAISIDFRQVKLLDLGVIRPHGTKPLTDGTGGKIFVGTLKYSPPEFLLREELDTKEGWRAITFYQLGGVLHDLIMRRSLFSDFEQPFARLVNAVQHEIPKIESKSVSPALVELARYCLLKPAETRLQLVSWQHFEKEPINIDIVAVLKSRITKRILAKTGECPAGATKTEDADHRLDEYSLDLQSICRLECVENQSIFPPVEIQVLPNSRSARQFIVQFEPSKANRLSGFLRLELTVAWADAESDISEVSAAAVFSSKAFRLKQMPKEKTSLLYKGIYAPDTVRVAVVTALYKAIDLAQQVDFADGEIKRSKSDDLVHQLDLGEESA